MPEEGSDRDHESRTRLEELGALMDASRADIDTLQTRADAADQRADASEARAEEANRRADASQARAREADRRADASEMRAAHDRQRIEAVESRLDLDRALIQALQDEGLVNREHAAHLEEALRSSRRIGAAIGIVMANRRVSEDVAFEMLSRASQDGNRKLRLVAEDIVHSGDTVGLLGA